MRRIFIDGKFEDIKNNGITGIVLRYDDDVEILKSSERGLNVWIYFDKKEKVKVSYLTNIGGRLSASEETAEVVTVETLQNYLDTMNGNVREKIDGIFIPIPKFNGLIWNDDLEMECEKLGIDKNENLIDLFDWDVTESTYRSWYYERAEKIIKENYLAPFKQIFKNISFDIGVIDTQYDLASKMINPFRVAEDGFRMCIKADTILNAETESMVRSIGEDNFDIIVKNSDTVLDMLVEIPISDSVDVLVIKPSRGVMERYIKRKRMKYLTETPALLAAMESTYYINMLSEKGFSFICTDEYAIEKTGLKKDGAFEINGIKFGQILICDSCRFMDKGIEVLKDAEENGVCINNEALIMVLGSELEE